MPGTEPLCFVLMPFGQKPDPTGGPPIDFNRIYASAIAPAIAEAGLTPIRADEECSGGIIHRHMFERLLLCQYAVADLTTANANVFYELGVRHAALPRTTLAIYAKHQPIPFDVRFLRAMSYHLGSDNSFGDEEAGALRTALAGRLAKVRALAHEHAAVDSPLFDLLREWKPGTLSHEKTDVFRDHVRSNEQLKSRMARARKDATHGLDELCKIREELGRLDVEEAGVVIDLMLSFRARKAWGDMIRLYDDMPETLRCQILTREQLAFALNRRAGETGSQDDRDRAVTVLEDVLKQQGPSPETCGLLGRIHKDTWDERRADDPRAARGALRCAIETYTQGFCADWRDHYPGVNAVTLLDILGEDEAIAERDRLLPLVQFAVQQRLKSGAADYWDHATMLELAVLRSDRRVADKHLEVALALVREPFEPETTARNLGLIREAREQRGEDVTWITEIIDEVETKAGAS